MASDRRTLERRGVLARVRLHRMQLCPNEEERATGQNSDYAQNPVVSVMAMLRQLECIMPDLSQPYDDLAAHYDQIFEDWEASITRQAAVLTNILNHECGGRR